MENLQGLRNSLLVVRHAPTLRIQALEKLRSAIIEGKIPAGSRLVERKLCDLLDVSRTVVREILRQLEAEGWIVNPPYKGPTVASISLDDARQIYEIRIALEGHAAKLAAIRATSKQITKLERVVESLANAARAGDVGRQIRTIEQFYETLLESAGNTMMSVYLASQRGRLARWRSMSLSRPERAAVSVKEKFRLVAAIRDRDPNLAKTIAEEHIKASAEAAFATIFEPEIPTGRKPKRGIRKSVNAGQIPNRADTSSKGGKRRK